MGPHAPRGLEVWAQQVPSRGLQGGQLRAPLPTTAFLGNAPAAAGTSDPVPNLPRCHHEGVAEFPVRELPAAERP